MPLKYLAGYPQHLQAQVHSLIEQGRLGTILADKYGQAHTVRSDSQLRDYVQALKDRHLRKSVPLGNVIYDSKLQVMKQDQYRTPTEPTSPYPHFRNSLHRRENGFVTLAA